MHKVDLHSHTNFSRDAWIGPVDLVHLAVAAGLNKIAITDHDEIDGALEAQSAFPEKVIVGEEINCARGTHLIGLFLSERVPPDLSVEETARRIRDQGGVVYAPHPFAYATQSAWHAARALQVADMVEVFNSRAFWKPWNRRAEQAALEKNLPRMAGTDSHFAWELGRAYTEMPEFSDAATFLESATSARAVGLKTSTPWIHVASHALEAARKIVGLRRPIIAIQLEKEAEPVG